MNRKQMLQRVVSLALCLTLAASACGAFSRAYAAGAGQTVYTFGNASGSFRDLAKEHEEEVKQREKKRKKSEREQVMREKKAMKKAEREARERERREKAAKDGAEEGVN